MVPETADNKIVYSVIIPAFNEERFLPKTLSSLKEAMRQVNFTGEIIVVDNNSTDKTAQIGNAYGARVVFEEKNQISRARNAGGKQAKGRYFIFLDADTTVSQDLLNQALSNLESGRCCGGGALLAFNKDSKRVGIQLAKFLNFLMSNRKLAAGCFMYCSEEAFRDIGGFSESIYASEEIWFARGLKKWGRKREKNFKVITSCHVVTSDRKLEHPVRVAMLILISIFFPFFVYFKALCGFWYVRAKTTMHD